MNNLGLVISKSSATLRGQVENKIREAISEGIFKPGQRLIERELCESLGVGRTSVREALRHLEAEGIITNTPHRGPSVTSVTPEEIHEIYELRALLEGHVGRKCAENADADLVGRLEKEVDDFTRVALHADKHAMIVAKSRYYDLLLEGCNNQFIADTLKSLHSRINVLWNTGLAQPGRIPNSLLEIRAVMDAVANNDGDAAEAACRFHVEQAATVALKMMEKERKEAESTD